MQLDGWKALLRPGSLAIDAVIAGRKGEIRIANGDGQAFPFRNLSVSKDAVQWTFPGLGMKVEFTKLKNHLHARFTSTREMKFKWPASGRDPAMSALILPDGEGLYLPLKDAFWNKRMADGRCRDTHGALSMPFWSYQWDGGTVTYLTASDLHTEVCISTEQGRLFTYAVHDFTKRDGFGPYEIEIWPGGDSPISPGIEYRQWLIDHGEYVSFGQKINQNPAVARLLGAIHAYLYGDGRTPDFLAQLKKLGIDRCWLGYDQDPRQGKFHVDSGYIAEAEKLGYLIGPYDTFENIQNPQSADDSASVWNQTLWETGCVIDRQGRKMKGFGGRGCELSSEALALAEPQMHYIEKRVRAHARPGINSYFLDSDAFGELFDDYSERHPMTLRQDRQNRLTRMRYIGESEKLVLGSEGGVGWAAPVIAFAHGTEAVSNDLLWALQRERTVFGGWWPPERPAIFFKPVAVSPEFRTARFDPVYRLPLYQAVFHSSLISTDRWEESLTKYPELVQTRELLELLYDVPSMWSFDLRELRNDEEILPPLYRFFSPMHRRVGGKPLSDFEWLTGDREVQRTRFGNELELTANFGRNPYQSVPPMCIEARWIPENRTQNFCPKP
jgi:Glycosyl hydrolases related to GH101 family, GH129